MIAVAAKLIGVLALLAVQGAAAEDFHIEEGPAGARLNEFSRQSNLQIMFRFEFLGQCRTKAVHGDLPPMVALAQMLVGTSPELMFDAVNDRTIVVIPKNDAGAPVDSETLSRWIRQFDAPAQTWAEDIAPRGHPLTIEIVLTQETFVATS